MGKKMQVGSCADTNPPQKFWGMLILQHRCAASLTSTGLQQVHDWLHHCRLLQHDVHSCQEQAPWVAVAIAVVQYVQHCLHSLREATRGRMPISSMPLVRHLTWAAAARCT